MRCLIFFSLFAAVFIAQAKVSVQINETLYDFPENPRLVEVLAKVAGDKQWYWPASALYRLDSSQAEKQRSTIIERLKLMQLSVSPNDATQATHLIEKIKQWSLADRIAIDIDYDAAQINTNNSPRFENGAYRLDLIERPLTASIFGLNTQTLTINLSNIFCVPNQILQLVPNPANKDFAYIIQPNGITKKIGIAYWNKDCVEIMPGSQIYLPLPESQFFEDNHLLNQQIIALAKNRIFK